MVSDCRHPVDMARSSIEISFGSQLKYSFIFAQICIWCKRGYETVVKLCMHSVLGYHYKALAKAASWAAKRTGKSRAINSRNYTQVGQFQGFELNILCFLG